jgi:hypothetical protein
MRLAPVTACGDPGPIERVEFNFTDFDGTDWLLVYRFVVE